MGDVDVKHHLADDAFQLSLRETDVVQLFALKYSDPSYFLTTFLVVFNTCYSGDGLA